MNTCIKCGSIEHSIVLQKSIILPKTASKISEIRLQCDDCGFEWK